MNISLNDPPYNASPSNTGAQNSAAFNSAIAAIAAAGGGEIWLRDPGTYTLDDTNPGASSWDNRRCIFINTNNIALKFARGTVLKLGDNQNAHVIKVGQRTNGKVTCDNVLIDGVSIDGNRTNQVTPDALNDHQQGIDVSSASTRVTIRDFDIRQCMYYGIGFQSAGFVDCLVQNGEIEGCGADGIDCKNNGQTSNGNRITGLRVRRFGLLAASLPPTQAGINFRGDWLISDVEVTEFSGDTHGIRYQAGSATDHTSGLMNFYVEAGAVDTTIGVRINIPPADETRVSTGRVVGCATGVSAGSQFNSLVDITATDCTTGFSLYQRANGTNLKAIDCTTGLRFEEDENIVVNYQAHDCATAIEFGASATFNAVRSGVISGVTTKVNDLSGGATNAVSQVIGIATDRTVSATFPVTSTGRQVLLLAHGLDATPLLRDCSAQIQRETPVTDAQYSAPEILAVDAANIVVSVHVTSASATGGATARLAVNAIAQRMNQ